MRSGSLLMGVSECRGGLVKPYSRVTGGTSAARAGAVPGWRAQGAAATTGTGSARGGPRAEARPGPGPRERRLGAHPRVDRSRSPAPGRARHRVARGPHRGDIAIVIGRLGRRCTPRRTIRCPASTPARPRTRDGRRPLRGSPVDALGLRTGGLTTWIQSHARGTRPDGGSPRRAPARGSGRATAPRGSTTRLSCPLRVRDDEPVAPGVAGDPAVRARRVARGPAPSRAGARSARAGPRAGRPASGPSSPT